MKKLITGARWKRYLAARSRRQARAQVRAVRHRTRADANSGRLPRFRRKTTTLVAPTVFSLVRNPAETVRFLNRARILSVDRNVFIDLAAVTEITPDAVAGLLAVINRVRTPGALISGNVPNHPQAKAIIESSGFRDYVRSAAYRPPHPVLGALINRQQTSEAVEQRFNQATATGLISFAMQKLTGSAGHHGPSYSVLGEAMLNTWNHATATTQKPEPWWASVYFDQKGDRACFTFIDQGVGIFKSHRLTTILTLRHTFRMLNSADILRKILEGEIRSSTGIEGRGNGLPGMCNHCKAGRIRNLTVISNDAWGNVETDSYQQLPSPFAGTLLYWEVVKS
jgi:hypothetical protein